MIGPTHGRRFAVLLLVTAVLVAAAAGMAAAQQSPSAPGSGSIYFNPKKFNPSMTVVIVVLLTAFFFLGFFTIYIRRCARGPFGGPGDQLLAGGGGRTGGILFASAAARSRRMRGLDPAVLEELPTMAYAAVKAHKAGKGSLECAVCLSEFDDDDTLRLLPVCSHAFHTDCIDAWLASHVTCPVCRANLAPDADAAAAVEPAAAAAATSTAAQDVPAVTPPPRQAQEVAAAAPEEATAVTVDAEETEEERIRREEAAELMRIGSLKRALRSKSARRPPQFPRSHTTGHSLAAPAAAAAAGGGCGAERYTLRLPEHVLREVVAARAVNLRRTASLQAFRTGGAAARAAGRSVRLGQSGRWPSVSSLARSLSSRLPAWGPARRPDHPDAPPSKGAKVAGDVEELCDGGACPLPAGGGRL